MATTIGRVYVPAPNPAAPRYGLFSVATGPLDLPTHARGGGVEYEIAHCELPNGYEVDCPAGAKITDTTGWSLHEADPFVIVASTECSPVGSDTERATRLAVSRLLAGEQAAVEAAFGDGSAGVSPSLANNPDAATLTAAADVVAGISALESWLYSRYGPRGVIHVPIAAGAYLLDHHQLERDGGVWRTASGTAVSIANFAGLAPDGGSPDPGHTTFYITGEVAVWRSADVFVPPYPQIIDRTNNVYFMPAEREYVVSFDCYVAGIDVTLTPEA